MKETRFNLYDNHHTKAIKQLCNDIEETYLKLIKGASTQMKLDFGIEDNNIYMPVYFKDDENGNDYEYKILYIISNDLKSIVGEHCIYDRYEPDNVEDCEYVEAFKHSWSIDEENVPSIIKNLKGLE